MHLLLCGRACSNAFDGEKLLDGEARLRGVHRQSTVGFLSLFEFYGSMVVGDFLKHPAAPVWVVVSESHYSVLWSPDGRARGGGSFPFTLNYWDQLANQEEVIRFTRAQRVDSTLSLLFLKPAIPLSRPHCWW